MNGQTFELGDVVELNSGSSYMTVAGVDKEKRMISVLLWSEQVVQNFCLPISCVVLKRKRS
jgi:hypothetical protein